MSSPQFGPIDDDTADLLSLLSEDPRKDQLYERFLLACRADAEQSGQVSVNSVRRRLSNDYGLIIEPRLYSSYWRRATGKNGPMVTTNRYEVCEGSTSGNDGRPFRLREWVGE